MELVQRLPDGATRRDHLLAAAAATGRAEPELLERVPAGASTLWLAFCELSSSRPAGGFSYAAIPPSEVLAWQSLHGVRLTGWEIDTLRAMDGAALRILNRQQTERATR